MSEYVICDQPSSYVVTKTAFRFRLTMEEYADIIAAADTDPIVRAWLETFNLVSQIDLSDKRAVDGIELLVAKELVTEERATEIMTAPIQPGERP